MAKKKLKQEEKLPDEGEILAMTGKVDAAEDQLSPIETLVGIVLRPKITFERMRDAAVGHWWVVAALMFLALTLVTIAQVPLAAEAAGSAGQSQTENTSTAQQLSEEEQAQVEQMQKIMTSQAVLGAIIGCAGAIGIAIGYLVRAGFVFLLGLALGSRATFKQVWRMAVWTTLPDVLRDLVGAIVIFATGSSNAPGLSYMLTGAEVSAHPYLVNILSAVDIYMVWSLVLLAIGLLVTSQLSRGKSAVIALACWLVTVAFALGLTAISQASLNMMGMG
ncbi:MAG: YIP1 family protein [Anaerolineae bacterium]|nr:YIP1 family protein [Anaerolineae bacterium]